MWMCDFSNVILVAGKTQIHTVVGSICRPHSTGRTTFVMFWATARSKDTCMGYLQYGPYQLFISIMPIFRSELSKHTTCVMFQQQKLKFCCIPCTCMGSKTPLLLSFCNRSSPSRGVWGVSPQRNQLMHHFTNLAIFIHNF